MDCEINLPKFNGIADNIIKTENNYDSRTLKLHYKCDPTRRCIMSIIKYLNSTDWKNFKFNQYSVKKNDTDYIITLNYAPHKLVFSK